MRKLQIAQWAKIDATGNLSISTDKRPISMVNSDGTGEPLLSQNGFGADVIRFASGKGVQNHVHEGDHILFVLAGEGFVIYEGEPNALKPGIAYYVPGNVAHAIEATTNLVMIAVGNQHFPVGSEERMTPVPATING